MARRSTQFVKGGYYHLYNRGAQHRQIFACEDNYRFLLQRIKQQLAPWQATMVAYCLMPTHYHFVMRQGGERPLSGFIQSVFNSYTKAFNKQQGQSGTLFEGPFCSIAVTNEDYLTHLCRYLHRNPLDAGLVAQPENWSYSNYLEWVGLRNGSLVDRAFIRERFGTPDAYRRFVMEYDPPPKLKQVVRGLALEA
jgi:putative transposase